MTSYGNPAFAGHELPMAGVGAGASQGEQRQGSRDKRYFKHAFIINCIAVKASMLQTLFING